MMKLVIITIMITIMGITKAADHSEIKVVAGDHLEEVILEAVANQTTFAANIRVIEANTITPTAVIKAIIMRITGDVVGVTAMAVITTEAVVVAEVITEALTIITTNITLMMMDIK